MGDRAGRWFNRQRIGGLFVLLFSGLLHAGTVTYVYTDPQGTVLAEADANGNITARYDYTPFGTSVASMSPAPNGPGYTGHVNDPDTGLVYMQARYYDPSIGRFLSVDPIVPKPADSFGFNRYTYANDNPIMRIDPNGKSVTCNTSSCTIESHSILEAAVDYTIVSVIYAQRLIENASDVNHLQQQQQQSQDQAPTNEGAGESAPALPTGLVGEEPRATGKSGGTAIGTSLPSDKFTDTVKALTGGTLQQGAKHVS